MHIHAFTVVYVLIFIYYCLNVGKTQDLRCVLDMEQSRASFIKLLTAFTTLSALRAEESWAQVMWSKWMQRFNLNADKGIECVSKAAPKQKKNMDERKGSKRRTILKKNYVQKQKGRKKFTH